MKRNVCFAALIAVIVLITGSCRKDPAGDTHQRPEELIAAAKTWHQNEQIGVSRILNSSKGKDYVLVFAPEWEKAKLIYKNGQPVITMPVFNNLERILGPNSSINLVVVKTGQGYSSKTVLVKPQGEDPKLTPEQLYQTAFTDQDISKEKKIAAEIKVLGKQARMEKNILYTDQGRQLLPPPTAGKASGANANDAISAMVTVCIEWKWVERHYDSQGNLTAITETPISIDCYDVDDTQVVKTWIDDGSGGGSIGVVIDYGESADIFDGSSTENIDSEFRLKYYTWTFHKALTWRLKSREKATLKKHSSGAWDIIAFSHIAHIVEGYVQNGDVSISYFTSTTSFTSFYAQINMTYQAKLEYNMPGGANINGVHYTGFLNKGKTFGIND